MFIKPHQLDTWMQLARDMTFAITTAEKSSSVTRMQEENA